MKQLSAALIVTSLLLLCGCHHRFVSQHAVNTVVSVPPAAGTGLDLASRFRAASEIRSSPEIENAMAKLAIDAASEGNTSITTKCLNAITMDPLKDNTAAKVALILAKKGKGKEAVDIATAMSTQPLRDATLSEIAGTK